MKPVLVGLLLALSLAACGGGDGEGSKDSDAFAERAGAICRDAVAKEQRAERRVDSLADGFEGSRKAFARRLAPYYDRWAMLTEQLFDDLEALEGRAPDKKKLRAFLAHVGQLGTNGRVAYDFLRAGEARYFRTSVEAIDAQLTKGELLAEELGVPECGRLGQPVRPSD